MSLSNSIIIRLMGLSERIIALEEEVTRLREYRVMLWALAPYLNTMLEASERKIEDGTIQPDLTNATYRVIAVWRVIKGE